MAITDETLEERVRAMLADDPRLPHPDEIAVVADESGGIVLRGTVGSLRQQRAAVADAGRTPGVTGVTNDITVAQPL
jgi:osmotically-inducible protein OsmY